MTSLRNSEQGNCPLGRVNGRDWLRSEPTNLVRTQIVMRDLVINVGIHLQKVKAKYSARCYSDLK